jgi:DNA polymerase (family X)
MIALAKAQKIAEKVIAELRPFCDQIAIAGSIRRQRETVGDIDIVVLPKVDQVHAFRARCQQSTTVVKDGEQEMVLMMKNEVQLDIWIAHRGTKDFFNPMPGNFGSLLLCRTGSVTHNIYLVSQAKALGLRWNPHHGVFDGHGRCLAAETEEAVFRALKLDFVPPERRER